MLPTSPQATATIHVSPPATSAGGGGGNSTGEHRAAGRCGSQPSSEARMTPGPSGLEEENADTAPESLTVPAILDAPTPSPATPRIQGRLPSTGFTQSTTESSARGQSLSQVPAFGTSGRVLPDDLPATPSATPGPLRPTTSQTPTTSTALFPEMRLTAFQRPAGLLHPTSRRPS